MGTFLALCGVLVTAAVLTRAPAGNTHLAQTQNDARML